MANSFVNGMTVEKRERQSAILDYIVANPGVPYTAVQMMVVFGKSLATIKRDMACVASVDPKIVHTPRYICYGSVEESKATATRYPDKKNEEGYSDPTAAVAMEKVFPASLSITDPEPGDVWDVQLGADRGVKKYIVLAMPKSGGFVTCVEYEKEDTAVETYALRLYSKPVKYFVSRVWSISDEQLNRIRDAIREYLGIQPVVETKEVRVEAGTYTEEQVARMLAEQRAEIYQECFNALVKVR